MATNRVKCVYNDANYEVSITSDGPIRGVHITKDGSNYEELDIYYKTEINYLTKQVVHQIYSFWRKGSESPWIKFNSNEHKYSNQRLEVNEGQHCDLQGNFVSEEIAMTNGVYNQGYTNYYKLWEYQMRAAIDTAVCEGIERHN